MLSELEMELIKKNARHDIRAGVCTEGYELDEKKGVEFLNELLQWTLGCSLHTREEAFRLQNEGPPQAFEKLLALSQSQWKHIDTLCQRIIELNGSPKLTHFSKNNFIHFQQSCSATDSLIEILVATRALMDLERAALKFFSAKDPVSRLCVENMLVQEEKGVFKITKLIENSPEVDIRLLAL